MTTKPAHAMYQEIRQTFFPLWDKKGLWTFSVDSRLPPQGQCNRELKRITLRHVPSDSVELQMLLIHEISHAISSGSHGLPWQRKMVKAASRAEELGRSPLAEMIRNNVLIYQGHPQTANAAKANVYGEIEDLFTMGAPVGLSFRDAVAYIAGDLGMYESELLKLFPRCKEVFMKARREARRDAENQKRYNSYCCSNL